MLSQLRNVNFGKNRCNRTGSTGVGYTVLDHQGNTVTARTTAGVYQLTSGSGLYAAYIDFSDGFRGQVMWDCPAFTGSSGVVFQSWAAEQFNIEENDPKAAQTWQMVNDVTGTVQALYDISYGRWRIDKTVNQMVFYKADNFTEVARFDLFDDAGAPAFDGVFERQKV